jgi:hypothetical protein
MRANSGPGRAPAPAPAAPQPLAPLERAVLESVVYSDVFDYALTAEEVWRGLSRPAALSEVQAALAGEVLVPRYVSSLAGCYTLRGREGLVAVRERRRLASRQLWPRARAYGHAIASLPFVRMVAVTGALAVNNSEVGDDLDYLVVTAPARLWSARAMTMLVVRWAGLRGVTVCPNYFLAADALSLSQRDAYTARELVQMAPVAGRETYARMLEVNRWWRSFLPNSAPAAQPAAAPEGRGRARAVLERALRSSAGAAVEVNIMRRKVRELRAQAGDNPEALFDEHACKGHFEAYGRRTREAFERRVSELLGTG